MLLKAYLSAQSEPAGMETSKLHALTKTKSSSKFNISTVNTIFFDFRCLYSKAWYEEKLCDLV